MFRTCFHSNSVIQATELLLQERTPRDSDRDTAGEPTKCSRRRSCASWRPPYRAASPRRITSPRAPICLSNGSYSVMLTAAGSGYSRWRDIAVTRWREDPTCDPWGFYVFLRDVANGEVWSAGYQPVGREPDSYDVAFFEDHAEIARRDGSILTSTEILVSAEDDAEVRRVSVTNQGSRVSEIELTTYAEVVLAAADADSAHPAFSKLFVQTEFIAESGALLATRRVRDPADPGVWVAHVSALEGEGIGGLQFETDRARFLGRGHDIRNAVSIVDAHPLSNTTGTVLDPVLALRRRVRIAPGETARIAFWTGVGSQPRSRLSRWWTSIATWRHSIARKLWRGPRLRCSSAIWASTSRRRSNFSALPTGCCTPIRRCARRATFSRKIAWGKRLCGPMAYPAICPSCWSG